MRNTVSASGGGSSCVVTPAGHAPARRSRTSPQLDRRRVLVARPALEVPPERSLDPIHRRGAYRPVGSEPPERARRAPPRGSTPPPRRSLDGGSPRRGAPRTTPAASRHSVGRSIIDPSPFAASGEPDVDAVGPAEDPLVTAGHDDVVPHASPRDQEMRDLGPVRRRVAAHDPGVRRPAGRAARRHEHLRLVGDEVRDRERVPRAAAPPERPLAHHREPEREGGERVGHHDAVLVVQHDVSRVGEGAEPVARGLGASRRPSAIRVEGRRPPGAANAR